jgi:hypothetical protein
MSQGSDSPRFAKAAFLPRDANDEKLRYVYATVCSVQ